MGSRRILRVGACTLVFTAGLVGIGASASGAAVATQLTRYPYLTDAVGTSITVSWATDRSSKTGSVSWGPVANGTCNPTSAVTATWYPITVNGVSQYQWTAKLSLPASGSYCYRPFLASTDLLGNDASPVFNTQVPAGSRQPFSFAVLGDWGQVDAAGNNPDQANLMSQIAGSGARFAVSVGDNGYPSGSQTNYGDLYQRGANVSAVFGPSFWPVPGRAMPMFAASGNHGITNTSGTRSTEQLIWPSDTAAATSGGRYVKETYCCVNGTASASYPSSWYAFDAGVARFYVLQADWADTNLGTGTVYANDDAAHWSPGSPEYQWLQADLAAHPGGLKFAFWHYPMYSDQKAQTSDTYLRGTTSLEGLLASNGVSLGFSGHAHIYERNVPGAPGTFVNYITGGGGATLQPIGETGCSPFDAYGIGWSPSKSKGSKCGAAPIPDAASRVYHFLKVTVDQGTVTVAPTDSLGRTFDVQTYTFPGVTAAPVWADGFESANTSAWSSAAGLTVQNTTVRSGAFAAEGNTTNGGTYAKKNFSSSSLDTYSRVYFQVKSASSQVNLLRHRTATDGSIAYVFVAASGQLGVRNDVAGTTTTSSLVAAPGSWHAVELHTLINGTSSVVEVWLDGTRVNALSSTTNLGTTAAGKMQIGEVQSGRTYDVVFDDAAYGMSRVGP